MQALCSKTEVALDIVRELTAILSTKEQSRELIKVV
jgi:hypothetical protein